MMHRFPLDDASSRADDKRTRMKLLPFFWNSRRKWEEDLKGIREKGNLSMMKGDEFVNEGEKCYNRLFVQILYFYIKNGN